MEFAERLMITIFQYWGMLVLVFGIGLVISLFTRPVPTLRLLADEEAGRKLREAGRQ